MKRLNKIDLVSNLIIQVFNNSPQKKKKKKAQKRVIDTSTKLTPHSEKRLNKIDSVSNVIIASLQ